MQIFISGCAKTRTTLVQWLFTAFRDTVVFPGELPVYTFRRSNLRYRDDLNLVIKRDIGSILSHRVTMDEYKDQISRIQVDGIKLVRVVRDKDDTLASEGGYVTPQRWQDCQDQAEMLAPLIAVEIDSDEILRDPDRVQARVAAALGLKINHPWSTWPDFINRDQVAYVTYPKFFNPLRRKQTHAA